MLRNITKGWLTVASEPSFYKKIHQDTRAIMHSKGYIDGRWVTAQNGSFFPVTNPATGDIMTEISNMGVEEAEDAMEAASRAFKTFRNISPLDRSRMLRQWSQAILDKSALAAALMSYESGKTYPEALSEVMYATSFLEWFAEEARRIEGEILSSPHPTKAMMHIKQPIGVAALITPWNFPMAMITRKAGAALAAGCTTIIKPAEDTPLTALFLADCAHNAGIPPGVLNVLPSNRKHSADIGKLLCEDPNVAAISFTGSTAVGKILYEQCAGTVKRLALELGGNAPFIVFESADVDLAVQGAIAAKFRNAGQTCICPNRFLIHESIYGKFLEKLTKCVKENFSFDEVANKQQIGPLINFSQLTKVDSIVKDAIKYNVKVLTGGQAATYAGPLHYEPTVLADVQQHMRCYKEEIFGPVVSCLKFSKETEAIKMANKTRSGLAGYFYSKDLSQIFRVAKQLEVGMIGINEGSISSAEAAFGGIKESGLGREGSHYGLDEFINIKYLCIGNL